MLIKAKHNQVNIKDLKITVHYTNWTKVNDMQALKSKDLKRNQHLLFIQTNNEQVKQYLGITNNKQITTTTTKTKNITIEETNKMFVATPKEDNISKPNTTFVATKPEKEIKPVEIEEPKYQPKDDIIETDSEINISNLINEVKNEVAKETKPNKQPIKSEKSKTKTETQNTEDTNILSNILNEVTNEKQDTEQAKPKRRGRPPKNNNKNAK